MAIERGRGARRFRTYLRKKRCYREIANELAHKGSYPSWWFDNASEVFRYYLVDEGRKHIRGTHSHCRIDCGPACGCDWHLSGIRVKYEAEVKSFDRELEEYRIFAPKTKPNRTWYVWKGRRSR